MKERGKAVDDHTENVFVDMPCKKHPYSSSVGICAECLKDRLVKLVCSECGEQRLSSCSCSDFSSYHDSSCMTADVGSVGRISFLIENEKPRKDEKSNEVILLKRSASSCVEVKKNKGFWKIKRLFKKRKEIKGSEKDGILDDRNEVWVSDILGVSRSRSLCSFRGGGLNDTDEGSDYYRFSSAKISDATAGGMLSDYDNKHCGFESRKGGIKGVFDESEPRKSGFRGVLDTSEPRNSGYSGVSYEYESEPRKSGFRGLYDEHEPRKSGFKGLLDASEPRNSGFSAVSYDSDPRKSGYRSLIDEPEARKSGFRGLFDDQEPRKSGFSGVSNESETRKSGFRGLLSEEAAAEPRKSGFRLVSDSEKEKDFKNTKMGCPIEFNRTHSVGGFSIKESYFNALDDSAFIDLNLDSSSKTEIPLPDVRIDKDLEIQSLRHSQHNGVLRNGGSCRMTVNDRLHKKEGGGGSGSSSSYNKVWKWLSKHYSGSRSTKKKYEDGKGASFFQKF